MKHSVLDRVPVKRALVSLSDKTGVVELCKALEKNGVEIISSGGTAQHLSRASIAAAPPPRRWPNRGGSRR